MTPIPIPRRPPVTGTRGRTCWVCGKAGGTGFTAALRALGYDVPPHVIAYAHNDCLAKAKLRKERP